MTFSNVAKQNGCASVGTLYREVLGEVVFPYDSIEKRAKVRHIVYNAIQISLVVSEFKIFGLLSLLERVLHRHGTCTASYLYYLIVFRPDAFKIWHGWEANYHF